MASDTIGFLEAVLDGPAHLVGWSDGGVGLLVAMARPDLVRKLVAIGANFDTSGAVPEVAAGFAATPADSDDVATLRGPYEAVSPDGPAHWPVVFAKFMEMFSTQPAIPVDDLARISAPTLVVAGDDDLITLEHTVALFRAVPNSGLAVVPGTSHMLTMEKPGLLNRSSSTSSTTSPRPRSRPSDGRRPTDTHVARWAGARCRQAGRSRGD
ncbi:MAG: alpha/beta fold hydrolase [Actinomycetes bacterium]